MPLTKLNQMTFHRHLYAGELKTITMLKRDDDQREGTVRAVTLFDCRRGQVTKTGEPIQRDMLSNHSTVWHIPQIELRRVGIDHVNPADIIVESTDDSGMALPIPRYWQPESTTVILLKLFWNMANVDCFRIDPTDAQLPQT